MSDPQSQPSSARPSKVTIAASLGGVSCVVLIFSLFGTLSRLRGVEMRDEITKTLSEAPFDTLAASTADVLAAMRVMAFVAGGLAAAGAVLAFYVARRHQGARVGFTVVAALLLLTTPVSGMLTFLVGFAAMLLWSEPSRSWFSGREPARSKADRRQEVLMSAGTGSSGQDDPSGSSGWPDGGAGTGEGSSSEPGRDVPPAPPSTPPPWSPQPPAPQPPQSDSPQSDSPQPPPYPGAFGVGHQPPSGGAPAGGDEASPATPPAQEPQPWSTPAPSGQQYPGQQAPYGQQPYGQNPPAQSYDQPYGSPYAQSYAYPGSQPGGSDKRPGTVTTAAVLTMLGAMLGLLAGVILMAGLSLDPGMLSDELSNEPNFEQLGWNVDQVLAALWVSAVILVGWSLSSIVLAVFTLRRQQWARWLLIGSATATALLSLLAIVSIVSIIPLVMAVVTVILLFTRGANAWFAGRDPQPPPSGPQPPQWSSSPGPW